MSHNTPPASTHTEPLFDAYYCLRAYPEFREGIITSIVRKGWPKRYRGIEKELRILHDGKHTLTARLARAFQKRYPGAQCIDPQFDATFYASKNNLSFASFTEAYQHWLTVGKQQGLWYAPGKRTVLTVILKTYNEDFFIDEWIRYYEKIVGLENIVVFDHSSNSERTTRLYKERAHELLIIRVPRHIEHDTLHNTKRFRSIFDLLKQHTLFFTLLDTDEFLCRFDGTRIVADGILDRLYELRTTSSLGTVWLTNYFDGTAATKPSDMRLFNIKDQPLRHNLQTSKSIFRHDCSREIIGHNRTVPHITIAPDLLLLHTKRGNFEARIASQIRACISFGLIGEHDDAQTIMHKLLAIDDTVKRHCTIEVLGYLQNRDEYIKKMIDLDETQCITTNVIAATLYNEPLVYQCTHPTETNIEKLLRAHAVTVADRFESGMHLASDLMDDSTSTQTYHLAP